MNWASGLWEKHTKNLKHATALANPIMPTKAHYNAWDSSFFKLNFYYTVDSCFADPGCLSRIPDPDIYPSRIPDPGSRIPYPGSKNSNKREGWKKFDIILFCSHKFRKIEYYFIFEMVKKKFFGPIFKELFKFLPKKFSLSSQKYLFGIRDRGSPIQGSERHRIPDPRSRIRIRNTGWQCVTERGGCAAQRSEICPWPGHVIHWLIMGGTWAEPVLPNTPGKNLLRLLPFRDVGCNQLCLINDINQLRVSGYKYKNDKWWDLFDNDQENASFHTQI